MRLSHWLWLLWGAMILTMMLKWRADTYMVIALIVLPILIVIMELHEEIMLLKEESKHQRKFVMDRFNILTEKISDISSNVEKKIVVDFSEFARENKTELAAHHPSGKKLKKKKRTQPEVDLTTSTIPIEESVASGGPMDMMEDPADADDTDPSVEAPAGGPKKV